MCCTSVASTAHAEVGGGFEFPRFPSAGEIAKAFADALGTWVNEYIRDSVPSVLGRAFLALFGLIGKLLWMILVPLLGPLNFITGLPEQWTVGLAPVERFIARFTIIGLILVGVCTVATTIRLIVALAANQNYSKFWRFYGRQAVAGALITFSLQLITQTIRFSNALSASLIDPMNGLTNLANTPDWSNFTAFGAIMLVFGWMFFKMALMRAKILVLTALCISVAPLMVAIWCIPFERAEQLFELWAGFTLGLIFIQIPQTIALGIGAALIASAVTVGSTGTDNSEAGVVAAFMGLGALGVAEGIHKTLSRRLFRTNQGGGGHVARLANYARMAAMAAGVGVNPATAPAAASAYYSVHAVNNATNAGRNATTTVASIAAAGPRAGQKMLPPPRG